MRLTQTPNQPPRDGPRAWASSQLGFHRLVLQGVEDIKFLGNFAVAVAPGQRRSRQSTGSAHVMRFSSRYLNFGGPVSGHSIIARVA